MEASSMRPSPKKESSRVALQQPHFQDLGVVVAGRLVRQVRLLLPAQQLLPSPLVSIRFLWTRLHPTTTDGAPWSVSAGVRVFRSRCSFTGDRLNPSRSYSKAPETFVGKYGSGEMGSHD